ARYADAATPAEQVWSDLRWDVAPPDPEYCLHVEGRRQCRDRPFDRWIYSSRLHGIELDSRIYQYIRDIAHQLGDQRYQCEYVKTSKDHRIIARIDRLEREQPQAIQG